MTRKEQTFYGSMVFALCSFIPGFAAPCLFFKSAGASDPVAFGLAGIISLLVSIFVFCLCMISED